MLVVLRRVSWTRLGLERVYADDDILLLEMGHFKVTFVFHLVSETLLIKHLA